MANLLRGNGLRRNAARIGTSTSTVCASSPPGRRALRLPARCRRRVRPSAAGTRATTWCRWSTHRAARGCRVARARARRRWRRGRRACCARSAAVWKWPSMRVQRPPRRWSQSASTTQRAARRCRWPRRPARGTRGRRRRGSAKSSSLRAHGRRWSPRSAGERRRRRSAPRGKRGRLAFDQLAGGQEVERPRAVVGRRRRAGAADEDAGADADLDAALDLERQDGLAHRGAGDAEQRRRVRARAAAASRRGTRRCRSAWRSARRSAGRDASTRRPAAARKRPLGGARRAAHVLPGPRCRVAGRRFRTPAVRLASL